MHRFKPFELTVPVDLSEVVEVSIGKTFKWPGFKGDREIG
jgi:hypothetical protein